jgi:hypothetical protein
MFGDITLIRISFQKREKAKLQEEVKFMAQTAGVYFSDLTLCTLVASKVIVKCMRIVCR